MRELKSLSLHFDGQYLNLLDQTLLPFKEEWIKITELAQMEECILSLRVRGAPLIGVAAAIFLAQQAELGVNEDNLRIMADRLHATRPTAVNLAQAMKMMFDYKTQGKEWNLLAFVKQAESIFQNDYDRCENIAKEGAQLIKEGDSILTHCNTGGLATAGVGTALGIIRYAHEIEKKSIHVYVDETRPLLQGGRLTTWELKKLKIPYTLICDNMAAILMRDKKIQNIFVGADRIAANGDFANKVGTYGVAALAKIHQVPFHVAAPLTTFDSKTLKGEDIPIEERTALEVRGVKGSFGQVLWAPDESRVYNPSFDVTPAELVSTWVTDFGHFTFKDVESGVFKNLPVGV
jgi:methylthioribose-1-phosphate isomerase